MRSSIKSLLVSLVVAVTAFAAPEGEISIRTRDGKTHQGRVLSETQKGYLFSTPTGTLVIEFANIVDLQKLEAASTESARPVALPSPTSFVEAANTEQTAPSREGFHFGLGAQVGAYPGGPEAFAQAHFDFNFGRPAYRINANFGVLGDLFNASVDNLFHFNVGKVYTLGAGVEVGTAFGHGAAVMYVAPVIQPVIIKLGDRGQHQISLTGSIVAFSTYDGNYRVSLSGLLQATAGYSFFF